jgi:hypothetical protein
VVCIILLTSEEFAECVKSFILSKMNSEHEEAREREREKSESFEGRDSERIYI